MTPWQRQGKNYRELCAANKHIKELKLRLADVDKVLHEAGADSVRSLHEACLAALERAERAEAALEKERRALLHQKNSKGTIYVCSSQEMKK